MGIEKTTNSGLNWAILPTKTNEKKLAEERQKTISNGTLESLGANPPAFMLGIAATGISEVHDIPPVIAPNYFLGVSVVGDHKRDFNSQNILQPKTPLSPEQHKELTGKIENRYGDPGLGYIVFTAGIPNIVDLIYTHSVQYADSGDDAYNLATCKGYVNYYDQLHRDSYGFSVPLHTANAFVTYTYEKQDLTYSLSSDDLPAGPSNMELESVSSKAESHIASLNGGIGDYAAGIIYRRTIHDKNEVILTATRMNICDRLALNASWSSMNKVGVSLDVGAITIGCLVNYKPGEKESQLGMSTQFGVSLL